MTKWLSFFRGTLVRWISGWMFLLALAAPAAEPVFISEFLASNSGGLRDEDGDAPDWIEIFNSSATNVNMNGWCLTDNADNLTRWRFPATNVPPNGFLIVFASGKNRAVAGAPLHANFSLNAGGEYLAMVHPDGVTIAHAFSPAFPEQYQNISYGAGQDVQVTKLISNTSPARVFVPTNGVLGTTWTGTNFSDSGWRAGTNGVGYETYVSGFAVRNIRANTGVCSLDAADSVLVTPSLQASVFVENRGVINYLNTESAGNFGGDFTFPGMTIGVDENNFVTEATGIITIPFGGQWTFGVNSDDGFRVDIGANTFSYPSPRAPGDTLAVFNLAAGEYPVRLVFYECGVGAEVEFFAASSSHSSFNGSFRLVGDTAGGGLAVKSLPTGGGGSLRPLITTDVQADMLNRNSSAYIRLPFSVANPAAFSTLTLRMKYDDGFVAYLNGTEVARRNVPGGPPSWNTAALANRNSTNALVFEDIDVTSALGVLRAGANVLAIQGLTASSNSTAFLALAELVENRVLGVTNHYFSTPSPGTFNGSGFYALVANLKFTPGRGWFDATNFSVTITSATAGVTIRYTTNGSVPSPTNGIIYTAGGIPVGGTTLIRAVGYRNGFEPTEVETHSYIFLNQVQAQSTASNPVGGSSGNYTLDPNITQSPLYGPTFKSDLMSVPTLSIVMDWEDVFGPSGVWSNPQAEGVAWERPCSLEYMRPDGEDGFNINCGIRIQGGASRFLVPKHGFRVLFKNIYGAGKLEYPLFDSPVQRFDTLTMHATFNDHWLWGGTAAQMIRDQWCRDTQNAMGGYGPHGTYAHIYVNGLYWGLYNIGEKGDASYASSYLGGEKEEYDAFNSDELIDGDANAWNTMFSIANNGINDDIAYTNISNYLNIPNFIDYMLMNFYGANADWPWHNWNAARRRVPGAGFHFFSWDAEWTFGIGNNVNTDRTGESAGSPGTLYSRLRAHPEFRVQFGDHAQKHLFNGGALTPAVADARWMKSANTIDRAIVCESARWGNGNTRATWLSAQSSVRAWFPQRAAILVNQLRGAALFPQLDAPLFAPFGGLVPPGYALALTNPNPFGSIYFTTNGADPRVWGGGLSASAQLYSGPLVLSNALFLRARVREGSNWSALVEAPFYVVQDFAALRVTEIMYNPVPFPPYPSEDLEFLELKNTGTNMLDLTGVQFAEGINFSFTNGTRLAPGAFFVLARTPFAFSARYPGVPVNGTYTGRLDNNGERLTLAHVLGTNVFSFRYDNAVPWPITPDGYGFSLVPRTPSGDPDSSSNWRASANLGGSPGADDPLSSIAGIVINEILTHTDPPQIDAIELFNPGTTNVNIGGWFLSDDADAPKKFRVPDSTVIGAGSFAVFYETNFNPQPGIPPSFALNSHGESLFLFSGDANTNLTGYSHSFDYGGAANGVSFGRHINSVGDENWPAMLALTLGTSNSPPRIGPLVINEVMYHPADGYDEFVELVNISGSTVTLYDPAFPTNAWKLSGLGYTFSNGLSVPAGGYLVLSSIDPAAFRTKYSVPPAAQVVGPFPGALQDSGERLRLERPDSPDTNGVPYIVVDEVRYNDKVPWPIGADGSGPSLQRIAPTVYGNEPTNWFASGITPGASNVLNQPPTVTFTTPTNGAMFMVPVNVTLGATASDPDGSILKVEFYEGDIKIGEDTSAPFSFVWLNAPVGTHTLVAKARDNGLAVAVSSNVTITIVPPPIGNGIGLRGDYFDNMDFTGTMIRRLDATVGFDWGEGSPDPSMDPNQFSVRWTGQVQPRFSETYTFYTVSDDGIRLWVNGQLIIDRYFDQAPSEWSGVISLQAGQLYDIRIDYYENAGGAVAQLLWSSPSVNKEIIPSAQLYPPTSSNQPPTVVLTGPPTGSVFVATSPVTVTANAFDPDGVIARVEFYANAVKIGEDNSGPFGISWTNNLVGTFSLTAVAVDDSSLTRTSAPVSVTFVAGFTTNLTLVATGAVWKYRDNGSDQGSAWTAIVFNDSGWSNGPAQLGYGDNDEATRVEDNPTPGYNVGDQDRYITTYFRRPFVVSDPASFTDLNLRVMRDDGVVVYLNGSEVYRQNMPGGPVSYLTPASANVSAPDESAFYTSPVNPGYLVPGTNMVAVEIHQAAANSSDISFEFGLTGVQSYRAPYFITQPQSQTVNVGSNAIFSAAVGGSTPLSYQWRFNGTNITGATNTTLVRSNVQPAHAGNYTLVTTNIAGSATSQVATLTVANPDADGDGIPDWWEDAYGLNRNKAADAILDFDRDGMNNLNEFRSGTIPTNALSVLKLSVNSLSPLRFQFTAESNLSYSMQRNTNLDVTGWNTFSNILPAPSVRTVIVSETNVLTNVLRFYRVVTP
jgi:hypothetical protein